MIIFYRIWRQISKLQSTLNCSHFFFLIIARYFLRWLLLTILIFGKYLSSVCGNYIWMWEKWCWNAYLMVSERTWWILVTSLCELNLLYFSSNAGTTEEKRAKKIENPPKLLFQSIAHGVFFNISGFFSARYKGINLQHGAKSVQFLPYLKLILLPC